MLTKGNPELMLTKGNPEPKKMFEKTLYFQDEKSDKVYKVWIEESPWKSLGNAKLYRVKAAYGRRGGTLTQVDKESSTLPENVQYHATKLIEEKKAKGYKENLTEAYSPLDETAATPNQIKLLKNFGLMVPPGLTKKQAQFMVEQYQNKNKPSKPGYGYPSPGKPGSMQPPTVAKPAAKEEPLVVSGPTGRRIKEID
jgi:predicted DNA-binding WGR domain protein